MALSGFTAQADAGKAPGDPFYAFRVQLDLDNSYPTGGYDVAEGTAARTLLNAVIGNGKTIVGSAMQSIHAHGGAGMGVVYNAATEKLMAFNLATGAEIANAQDLSTSGANVELLLFCK